MTIETSTQGTEGTARRPARHRRAAIITAAVLLIIVVALILFDWNWLRPSLNSYITRKTHREFTSSDLHVRLGWNPTIRLRGVTFANADWAQRKPMAKLGEVEFSVSLRDLFDGKILVPRVALTDAELHFEQMADHRRNWVLSDPNDKSPSRLRISSLSVTRGNLEYTDHAIPMHLNVAASTFDPQAQAKAGDAKAAPDNRKYTTRFVFDGQYHDASFKGDALTGDVLSFQQSGVKFPLRAHLLAGTTQLDVEGVVADAADISAIDVKLRIAGQTLANLYPFLLLPLPASPPYRLEGHLTQVGARYGLDDLKGHIGETDVSGNGAYVDQKPRPLLQARLRSDLLNIADLGPLVGIQTKGAKDAAPPTQAQTRTRPSAQAAERQTAKGRVLPAGTPEGTRLLPSGKFEGGRLKAIDADAELTAKRVKAPDALEVANVKAVLHLKDGVLKLDPFDVDFAGGRIESAVDLDARQPTIAMRLKVQAERLQLAHLLPKSDKIAQSQGAMGANLLLSGKGNSIADAAADADGHIGWTLSQAQISNLVDAAAGLNGGKVIALLIGGDEKIPVRCGVASFDVKDGKGRSTLFLVDTQQTRIDGAGSFDLGEEHFDAMVAPKPKHVGILSLRTPLHLYGSFRDPQYELDKKKLALRAGSVIGLALVAPAAALIPLIEPGPGADIDCKRLTTVAMNGGHAPAPAPVPAQAKTSSSSGTSAEPQQK